MAGAPTTPTFPTTLAPDDPDMLLQAAEAAKYRAFITVSAAKYGLPVCVVCGIGSRESEWGLALKPRGPAGTGDQAPRALKPRARPWAMPPDGLSWGRGLMQIDYEETDFAKTGPWRDPQANIDKGCQMLSENWKFFKAQPDLKVDPLRAAIAAYNRGQHGVLKDLKAGLDVDAHTAPPKRDYSRDVLNRAGWFQAAGW